MLFKRLFLVITTIGLFGCGKDKDSTTGAPIKPAPSNGCVYSTFQFGEVKDLVTDVSAKIALMENEAGSMICRDKLANYSALFMNKSLEMGANREAILEMVSNGKWLSTIASVISLNQCEIDDVNNNTIQAVLNCGKGAK